MSDLFEDKFFKEEDYVELGEECDSEYIVIDTPRLEETEEKVSIEDSEEIKYPCISVGGVRTIEEAKFIKTLCSIKSEYIEPFPLYLIVEGELSYLSDFTVTHETLLKLSYVCDTYDFVIHKSDKDSFPVNLKDPQTFLRFMVLEGR